MQLVSFFSDVHLDQSRQATMAKSMDLRGAQLMHGSPFPPCGGCDPAGGPDETQVLDWMPSSSKSAEWRSSFVSIAWANLLQLTAPLFCISATDVAPEDTARSEKPVSEGAYPCTLAPRGR